MEYKKFKEILDKQMGNTEIEALKKISVEPERFISKYRFLTPKEKINQFISQSKEVRFGKFLESIFHYFFEEYGAKYLERRSEDGLLEFDHLFEINNKIILIEQKIRDDHDSGKKRSNVANYKNKKIYLKEKYKDKDFLSCMWFVDDTLSKNKNYYKKEIGSNQLFYGKELILFLLNIAELKWENIWLDFFNYINQYQNERFSNESSYIIDINNVNNDWSIFTIQDIINIISNETIKNQFLEIFISKNDIKYIFLDIIKKSTKKDEIKKNILKLLEVL